MLELVATFIEIFFSLQFRRFDFGTTTLLEKKTRFSLWVHCTKIKIASFIHVLAHCDFGMHYKKFPFLTNSWNGEFHRSIHTHTQSLKLLSKAEKLVLQPLTIFHGRPHASCQNGKFCLVFFKKNLYSFLPIHLLKKQGNTFLNDLFNWNPKWSKPNFF